MENSKIDYTKIIICKFFQACAGLIADARAIVEIARIESSNYRSEYGVPIPCAVSIIYYS